MATLRNLAVSIHRLTGATNIAAACRHVAGIQTAPWPYSHNGQIDNAETLVSC
jgi:hypothetical protein